jgi:hypothetical protein
MASPDLHEDLSHRAKQDAEPDLKIRIQEPRPLGGRIGSSWGTIAFGRDKHFGILQLSKLLTSSSEEGCNSVRLP